jgi:hypothetical protein
VIDFRYHLVSIASIFLALAVGIVLGAGPLRGTIGDTLASEVTRLREEANTLRSDLGSAQAQVEARNEAVEELRPRSVAGALADTTVGVVVLPGASDGALETTLTVLGEAGAETSGAVTLSDRWASSEPPDATARSDAGALLRELLAGELPVGLDPQRVIDLALARALAGGPDAEPEAEPTTPPDGGPAPGQTEAPETEDVTSRRVLEILAEYGLAEVDEDGEFPAADAVVIVAPESIDSGSAATTGWLDVIGAIDDAAATVVVGDIGTDATVDTDLIAAIRDSEALADRISTVDNVSSPFGSTALPFAVVEQVGGDAGHYGVGETAAGLLPPVPPPAS